MASLKSGDRVRLRIAEIGLQPATSKRVIKAELHINDKMVKELSNIVIGQPLAEAVFIRGLEKSKHMDQKGNHVKLKAARRMFKSMLEFGSIVAEASVHPVAKTVFAVCMCAWEGLEERQKSGEELEDLAGRLVEFTPFVDEVKKHARLESLQQNIEEFLNLIEDISIFAMKRDTKGSVIRVLQSFIDSGDRDRVEGLTKRFQKIHSDFNIAIGVQTMAMVAKTHEQELLKRLNHVEPSGHDPSRGCQEGTRLGVLADIDDWIQEHDPTPSFLWIYGQAGIGKSTISASVCTRSTERGIPTVAFFCKRDDPALRDPLRLINSIAYGLACRHPPYSKLVVTAIEANPDLCTSHLKVRYEGLLKKPLVQLQTASPLPPFLVLIDALDECENSNESGQLLAHLHDLSSTVPWLKVIVTSRPDSDICNFFDQCPTTSVTRRALRDYTAASDIRIFIEARLGNFSKGDIDKLCVKAGELFLWAATACKFITNSFNPGKRLRQLVDGNAPDPGFDDLDSLYATVIQNSMVDQAEDTAEYVRQCLGAIVATSMRQPVPMEVLCKLMPAHEHVNLEVLKKVVEGLGAVLYTDRKHGGAIRVSHPSFVDFMLDKRRSGKFNFWTDPIKKNIELLFGCISTMKCELMFNICALETSHLLNSDVPSLESKIKATVSGQLAYSCAYWISHLLGSNEISLAKQVEVIDGPRLLYWLEVLSLLQKMDVALHGLRELSQWLLSHQQTIAPYIQDAYRFVFAFFDPITSSTPHIYISALALAPKLSKISRGILPLLPNTVAVVEGGDETWPTWLRTMSHPDRVTSLTGGLMSALCHRFAGCELMSVAISPDSTRVASGFDEEVQIWDANTGSITKGVQIRSPKASVMQIQALAFSPDGATLSILSIANADFRAVDADFRTMDAASQIKKAPIWDEDATPPTKPVKDFQIQLTTWDMGSEEIMYQPFIHNFPAQFATTPYVTTATFSPDGARIAVGYENQYLIIASQSNPVGHTVVLPTRYHPGVIVFSPEGSLIASNSTPNHQGVQIWNAQTGTVVGGILAGHIDRVRSIAFSLDGIRIVTGSDDHTVRIWDTATGNAIGSPFLGHAAGVTSVAFSPDHDGAYVFSGSSDKTVLMWDASTNNSINMPTKQDDLDSVTVTAHSQGHTPVDNRINPVSDSRSSFDSSGHSSRVDPVSVSADDGRITSGLDDSTVRTQNAVMPCVQHKDFSDYIGMNTELGY
ncbi:hypothetical protein FRC11_012683 [Ceratobasidium sp. 423]|nr:hypothetical protein FRC11_012683 [Ceratobasidium sp. 423]